MYVLKCTEGIYKGKYVAKPGSNKSYTDRLDSVQIFSTYEDAERNSCVENETPVNVENFVGGKW
jgi:hypothetical protein